MSDGSILPVVRYANPAEAADWLCRAYGFSIHHVAERPGGGTAYIVLRFGENSLVVAPQASTAFDDLMVQPADVGNRSTQACYLTVQDVDQHCAHARRAGARVKVEPSDDGTDGRFYMCCDPEGHLWSFGGPLVGQIPADPDCPSERPRRHPALSSRASISLAALASVAVGCGAIFNLGIDLAPKALTAWNDGIGGQSALSIRLEEGANASATKRLPVAEAGVLDLTEKLQISRFEFAEAQQLKRNAEKLLNTSEAEYQDRLKDSQDALDAAVRAKELASQALEAERHRAQAIQTQLDEVSQELARLRAEGDKFEAEYQGRLKDGQAALEAAVRAKELASQELKAERHRTQAIQTLLDEASRQLARLRADGSKFESRLKDSQGALDAAVRAKELAAQELKAERHRAQAIQTQLDEASRQLGRLRSDGLKFEVEARQLRDAMAQLGDALPGSAQAGGTAHGQLATAQSTGEVLRERLRASEREARELELRARMTVLEMDKEAARLRAEQAAESARTALTAARASQFRPRDNLRAGEPGTADVPAGETARGPPEPASEVAHNAPPATKIDEGTLRSTPRATYVRPLPQRQLAQSKKSISVAAIAKAKAERQRQAAEAAAAAQKAEEERQRVAAEAARRAEAERKRLAAEAAQKAEVERQRQAAEVAAAARKAEKERQRLAAETAQKAEAERQRQAAEAAAAARKIDEERQRLAAEAAQKAEAARVAKEAVEAEARADQEARRQKLGLTVTSEDGARFLARGRALLTTGDVTSARLFLERASNAGLAEAAMELAETYDPATVTRLSAIGLVGDREQARAWYARAKALGSSAAAERLKSIVGQ